MRHLGASNVSSFTRQPAASRIEKRLPSPAWPTRRQSVRPTQILSGFGLNDPSFKCFAEIRSSANILVSRGACCPPVRPGALTVSPDMRAPGRCRSPLPVKDRACSGCTWPRNSSAPRTSLLGRVQAIAMIWTPQLRTSRRPMRSFRTKIAA